MTQAISGHGALLAMEKDPGGSPGVFTTVAELNSDLGVGANRPETEATPHNDTIDSWVFGVLRREPWSFTVNFLFDDDTHDHLTGLQKLLYDGTTFGMRFRGPGSTGPTDEIIVSGQVTNMMQTNPVREGIRTAEVTFRPSGLMSVDGVAIGTVAS